MTLEPCVYNILYHIRVLIFYEVSINDIGFVNNVKTSSITNQAEPYQQMYNDELYIMFSARGSGDPAAGSRKLL